MCDYLIDYLSGYLNENSFSLKRHLSQQTSDETRTALFVLS